MASPAHDRTLIAFGDLLDALKRHGFAIGVNHYLRLAKLLPQLSTSCAPDELKTLLCPLFAKSREQQEQFHWVFEECYGMLGPHAEDSRDPARSDRHTLHEAAGDLTHSSAKIWLVAGTVFAGFVLGAVALDGLLLPDDAGFWILVGPLLLLGSLSSLLVVFFAFRKSPSHRARLTGDGSPIEPNNRPRFPVRLSLRIGVLALLGTALVWSLHATQASQAIVPAIARLATGQSTNPTIPRSGSTRQTTIGSRLSLVLLPFIIFALVEARYYRRRRLLLYREEGRKPPLVWPIKVPGARSIYAGSPEVRAAARLLNRREFSDNARLSMEESIAATIQAAGYPTLRFRSDTRPTEYLVLIERASIRDHRAELFADLCRALQTEGVHVVRYYYDRDPRVCFEHFGGPGTLLLELKQRFPSHQVLVFGNGDGLIDPVTGQPLPWIEKFFSWNQRAFFTTATTTEWGAREIALARYFIVLPASAAALRAACEFFSEVALSERNSVSEIGIASHVRSSATDVRQLRAELGPALYEWLSVCAIYSELQWDLTLHLGALVARGDVLITENNLLRLMRLPWFRKGSIPSDIRATLLEHLDPRTADVARKAILILLENNPPPLRTAANALFQLEIAAQRAALLGEARPFLGVLRKRIQGRKAAAAAQEVTRVKHADQLPRSSLALVLSARLKRMLRDQAVPLFTRGSALRLAVPTLAAMSIVIAFLISDGAPQKQVVATGALADSSTQAHPDNAPAAADTQTTAGAPAPNTTSAAASRLTITALKPLHVGDSAVLRPRLAGDPKVQLGAVTWSSSAPEIARIDQRTGSVVAVREGSTTITGSANGSTATMQLRVMPAAAVVLSGKVAVAQIIASDVRGPIHPGDTIRVVAAPLDAHGASLPDRKVTWQSTHPEVATVDAYGLVTGRGPGGTEIVATSEQQSIRISITVTRKP